MVTNLGIATVPSTALTNPSKRRLSRRWNAKTTAGGPIRTKTEFVAHVKATGAGGETQPPPVTLLRSAQHCPIFHGYIQWVIDAKRTGVMSMAVKTVSWSVDDGGNIVRTVTTTYDVPCARGHRLTPENTVIRQNSPYCLDCERERSRESYERQLADGRKTRKRVNRPRLSDAI